MRSGIEQYIINRVKELRLMQGKTQLDLAEAMGFKSTGYIGKIESDNPSNQESYNIDHLNQLAKILDCSPKDFWPDKSL